MGRRVTTVLRLWRIKKILKFPAANTSISSDVCRIKGAKEAIVSRQGNRTASDTKRSHWNTRAVDFR
jgi:hypothetical protein